MKLKNILLSSLLASTIGCITASADITSLAEVSPNNFNKQVFGLSLLTQKVDLPDGEGSSYLDSVGLLVSNKATLMKFNYGSAELYWRGKMGYDLGLSTDMNGMIGDLAFGLTKDFKYFYTTAEIGYDYSSYKSDSGEESTNETKHITHGVYSSLGLGIPLGDKYEIGLFGTLAQVNQKYEVTNDTTTVNENEKYLKTIISVPITYNVYKTISINTKFSHEIHDNSLSLSQDKITFGLAWQYNN